MGNLLGQSIQTFMQNLKSVALKMAELLHTCPNFRTTNFKFGLYYPLRIYIVQTFELTNFKVWTVLSTEENVLLRLFPPPPEMSSFVPSAITQPFFELQTPDFAWKFVWTVPTNYAK